MAVSTSAATDFLAIGESEFAQEALDSLTARRADSDGTDDLFLSMANDAREKLIRALVDEAKRRDNAINAFHFVILGENFPPEIEKTTVPPDPLWDATDASIRAPIVRKVTALPLGAIAVDGATFVDNSLVGLKIVYLTGAEAGADPLKAPVAKAITANTGNDITHDGTRGAAGDLVSITASEILNARLYPFSGNANLIVATFVGDTRIKGAISRFLRTGGKTPGERLHYSDLLDSALKLRYNAVYGTFKEVDAYDQVLPAFEERVAALKNAEEHLREILDA